MEQQHLTYAGMSDPHNRVTALIKTLTDLTAGRMIKSVIMVAFDKYDANALFSQSTQASENLPPMPKIKMLSGVDEVENITEQHQGITSGNGVQKLTKGPSSRIIRSSHMNI
jgi:hypothetical protein